MQHPGRQIEERFLKPLGIRASQLARALGVDRSTVSRLLSGQQPITPSMAARLGVCFGVPARWFLLMQAEYDAACVEADPELASDATPIEVDPDWLLTPDGAMSLVAEGSSEEAPAAVRTVRLENGAVALLSEAS